MLLLLLTSGVCAQQATLQGTVRDATTHEGIPGAAIYFKKSPGHGTSADADGHFSLATSSLPGDTLLVVSSVGFETQTQPVPRPGGPLRIQLRPAATQLGEVVVHAHTPENPAYAIIRRAVAQKEQNRPQHLPAYELESYTRLELLLTNTAGLQNRRALQPVKELLERQGSQYRDAQGRPLIPLSVTETVGHTTFRRQPQGQRDDIVHTQTSGIGLELGDGATQLLSGSGFRDYDFYQNQVRVLNQSLPSPIADSWHFHYEYELQDSVEIDGETTYRIAVLPRRKTDLVFAGTIWVTRRDDALRQLDLHLAPEANINFVQSLRIRQQGQRQAAGVWLARTTDYTINLNLEAQGAYLPGVRMQLHTTNRALRTGPPMPPEFFQESRLPGVATPMAAAALTAPDPGYWQQYRTAAAPTDSLPSGPAPYALIDSIKALPSVRAYTFWGRTLASGYLTAGQVELGPLAQTFAHNTVEGNRFAVGLRTTPAFSRSLNLDGFLAYGTRDRVLKYNVGVSQVLSGGHFTQVGGRFRSDLEPLAQLSRSFGEQPSLAVAAFNHWGNLRGRNPFSYREITLWLERELRAGLTTRITGRTLALGAASPVPYQAAAPRHYPFRPDYPMVASELELGLRYNRDERVRLTRTNRRKPLRRQATPTFTLTGILGQVELEEPADSRPYQKLLASIEQRQFPLVGLGLADLSLQAGYTLGTVPYALLKVHRGNDSPFLYRNASQGMRTSEFASDHFVELHYTHFFNDLLLGQLPGIRTLNYYLGWRLLATTNIVWGGMRPANVRYNQLVAPDGRVTTPFRTLGATPYVEVGYGVENIFHFLRLDFVHRLTYRTPLPYPTPHPGRPGNFQIRLSAALKL